MRYLTADELRDEKTENVREVLEKCTGKCVRDNFAFEVFDSALEKYAIRMECERLGIEIPPEPPVPFYKRILERVFVYLTDY